MLTLFMFFLPNVFPINNSYSVCFYTSMHDFRAFSSGKFFGVSLNVPETKRNHGVDQYFIVSQTIQLRLCKNNAMRMLNEKLKNIWNKIFHLLDQ